MFSWHSVVQVGKVPCGRAGHASVLLPPCYMLVLGGSDENDFCNDAFVVKLPSVVQDPVQLHWNRLHCISSSRRSISRSYHTIHYIPHSPGLCLVLGNVIARVPSAKGKPQFSSSEFQVDLLSVSVERLEIQWKTPQKQSRKPTARHGHCSVLKDDSVYLFGGKNAAGTQYFDDLIVFDYQKGDWGSPETTGEPPRARAFAGIVHCRGNLYIYGGCDAGGDLNAFSQLHVLSLRSNHWSCCLSSSPSPRINHTLSVLDNNLLVFGGRSKTNSIAMLFNFDNNEWIQPTIAGNEPDARTAQTGQVFEATDLSGQTIECFIAFGGYTRHRGWLSDSILFSYSIEESENLVLTQLSASRDLKRRRIDRESEKVEKLELEIETLRQRLKVAEAEKKVLAQENAMYHQDVRRLLEKWSK